MYRKDILALAYERCQANRGAAGVDGQEFDDIAKYGVGRWLDELARGAGKENVSTSTGATGDDSEARGW